MPFIFLNDQQTRNLFLNKYLESREFLTGFKPAGDCSSFEIPKNTTLSKNADNQLIFLSQFSSAFVKSEKELNIFHLNYEIPRGFLHTGTQAGKSTASIIFSDPEKETEINPIFLSLRSALLQTFTGAVSGRDADLRNWFSMMNNLTALSGFEKVIIAEAIAGKDFPQVPITGKFAKSSKKELQFIFLGRILGDLFFRDNNGKSDDVHRNWLLKLHPDGELKTGPVPERFTPIAESVLGYIIALKYHDKNQGNPVEIFRNNIQEIRVNTEGEFPADEVFFYYLFWTGLLKNEFTRYFHTSITSEILLSIEKKAYGLTMETKDGLFDLFTEDDVNHWIKIKSEKTHIPGKRFSEFCKMHSGEVPKEKTLAEVLAKTEPYNLRNKKVLLFFFTGDQALNYLATVLRCISWIEHVFLIYLHPGEEQKDNSGIETDRYIGSIKKEFCEVFRNISFETTVKKMNNADDREIINNLKGFMKNRCNEDSFLFYSSAGKPVEDRISLWIGKAISKTPVFESTENYLFVH